jgi:outer membrane protein TolC
MLAVLPGASRVHVLCGVSLFLSLEGCAAPAARPLDLDRTAADVVTRSATPEQVAQALDLADWQALPFERPRIEEEPDYDGGGFWHATALAFNGELRSAQRRWAEATALARSGGAPEAAEIELEQTGFDSADRQTWLAVTFDILGFLDAGRAAAARELARAEARVAWADVENVAWSTSIAVDRARAELGDSLSKVDVLTDLLDSSKASVARAELLFERGRLSESEIARLRGMVAEVDHQLHEQRVSAGRSRRALADAAGLPPNAPALDTPTRETLENMILAADMASLPEAHELLQRSPPLRRARLEYAVAEAVLRDEVARTRPGLRLGPALQFTPDETLPGGVLVLDLPHARALSGRVEAARQARERARENLEELLRASLARVEAARTQYESARGALAQHATARDADTNRVWLAARARFEVDPMAADELGMALRDRAMALLDLSEVKNEMVLAWLDIEEATGPAPRPLPGEEPPDDARRAELSRGTQP